jgi:hypothetical protein
MPGKFYTPSRFVLLFFLLAGILLLRRPDMLTNPQLYAEDGSVFLRDQLVFPGTAVFFPYNGQFHLLPRILALFESFCPLVAVPVLCSIASVLINSLCLTIFFLPWNRWLIENDWLRAAVSLVLATTLDGAEMLGFSGPLMWYLFLVGILLLFRPESSAPQTTRGRSASVAAMALIGMSVAPMVTLAPMVIWLAIKRRGIQRLIAVTLLAVFVAQFSALAFAPRTDHPAQPLSGWPVLAAQVATATVVTWVYGGVLTPLMGKNFSFTVSRYASIGPPLFAVIGLAIVVTWLLTVSSPRDRARLVFGLYLCLATLASVLYTRNLIGLSLSLTGNAPFIPARYMVLDGALLLYMVCLLIQRLPLRDPRFQAACLVLVFALGIRSNFHQQPYPDFHWKAAVPQLVEWRAAHAQGKPDPLVIPIDPSPWAISLP